MTAQAGPKEPITVAFDAYQETEDYRQGIGYIQGVTKPSAILCRAFRAGWEASSERRAVEAGEDVAYSDSERFQAGWNEEVERRQKAEIALHDLSRRAEEEMMKWANDHRTLYPDNEIIESLERILAANYAKGLTVSKEMGVQAALAAFKEFYHAAGDADNAKLRYAMNQALDAAERERKATNIREYEAQQPEPMSEDVRHEMWRIRSLFRYTKDDSEDLITYAKWIVHVRKQADSHGYLLAALTSVRALIAEASMTGFNCKEGDWAERLFASQQITSAAIKKAETAGSSSLTSKEHQL